MYTEEQFDQLEQQERVITNEAILFMLYLLAETKANLEKELRSFYQRYGKDGVVTYAEARKWVSEDDHRRRLVVLLLFVSDEFNKLFIKLNPEFDFMLNKVIDMESRFFDVELDDSDLTDQVWGVDDQTWLDRLESNTELWCAYIATEIKQGLLKRMSIDQLLERIGKRFESMEHLLDKLALTESTAVGSLARKWAFKLLGVRKYQFYTRADERTCEVCGGMHGMTFPISAYEIGVTASPLHPRCRCWEVPIWD